MTRKFQKRPRGEVLQFEVGGHRLWTHMSLSEFFALMALCRRGPSTSSEVAREASTWLDTPLPPDGLERALHAVAGLGSVRLDEGIYTISSDGTRIIRSCHIAYTRMLGSGVIHLDVAAARSCAAEFERS